MKLIGILVVMCTMVGCGPFQPQCTGGESCRGNDGDCMSCSMGSCSSAPVGNCSNAVDGVYCCVGGSSGGGDGSSSASCSRGNTYNFSSGTCCPNSAPYYYPGTHGIKSPGCYSSCPYINDCGTKFEKF